RTHAAHAAGAATGGLRPGRDRIHHWHPSCGARCPIAPGPQQPGASPGTTDRSDLCGAPHREQLMNCLNMNEMLDNLRLDRLEPRQRQQIEAHVAACADCAQVWNAQSTLAALPDEPMPADLRAQCLAAVAAQSAATTTNRRPVHRRVLIWGSLTAVAAAATTFLILPEAEIRTT